MTMDKDEQLKLAWDALSKLRTLSGAYDDYYSSSCRNCEDQFLDFHRMARIASEALNRMKE
jgi:hypothetical protein